MSLKAYSPSPLADVECLIDGKRSTLVFIHDFKHPPEKVWQLLTDPQQQEEWAPFVSDRNLSTLGNAKLVMTDREHVMRFDAKVTHADAPTLLEYFWNTDLLRWELETSANGTRLTLKHTTDHQDWIPKVAAGWHICLDVAEYFLDGNPIGKIVGEDAKNYGWQQLNDAYAEKLNIKPGGFPEDLGESR